jgi:uncharacterized membrane protein YjjP (DUF1212 family)
MYNVIDDRIFWIYVIITLFFIIIGVGLIISSNDLNLISINILWLISMLALMINAYYIYNDNDNYFKIFIIIIFISLLIISVLWTGELWNKNDNQLLIIFSILILLGGFILFGLRTEGTDINTISYWSSLIFVTVWLCLILYIIN